MNFRRLSVQPSTTINFFRRANVPQLLRLPTLHMLTPALKPGPLAPAMRPVFSQLQMSWGPRSRDIQAY
jgi:hypothetical protein